jgi:hypothetical protein
MSLDWLFQHFVDPTPHPTVPGKPANFLSPCDQRCVVIAPATDVTDRSTPHPARYNLKKGAPIGGVLYADLADGPQKAIPTARPPRVAKVFFDDSVPRQMDPRHIIATTRFSTEVRTAVAGDINLQVVYHAGLGTNGANDCHGWGRALDFSGFSGRAPDRSARVKRTVARLDAERKVIRVEIDCFEETMTEDHFIVQFDWGDATPQPPSGTVASLPYRLAPSLAATTREGRAARIFRAIYDTAKRHWRDTASGSNIGEQSAIMNPDHPTSDPGGQHGREAHQNHLHMQIGATGPTDTVPFDRFVTPAPPPPPPPSPKP